MFGKKMIERINVLLVSPVPPPIGGIASWTIRYLDWMKKNEHNVFLVDSSVIGRRSNQKTSKISIVSELIRTYRIIKNIKRNIKKERVTIIHINTSCSKFGLIRDFFCANIAKRNNLKVIIHYRCNIEDQIAHRRINKKYLKKISNIADINLVLNDPSLVYLKQNTRQNIIIIPNIVDDYFRNGKQKIIREKVHQVCFTGHIKKTKGIQEILNVSSYFPEINFLLAGPIYEKVNKIQMPTNVKLLGPLEKPKVKQLLSESDIFLFPTHTEGFSNSLLEAMAMGLPIITSKAGANPDMIEDKGGVLVNHQSLDDIKNAIKLLMNSGLRKEMSNWNVRKVESSYTVENIMKKIIELYKGLLL